MLRIPNFLALLLGLSSIVWAQKPEVPPPSAPFVSPPPEFSQWRITISASSGASVSRPHAETLAIHTKGIERFQIDAGAGQKDIWYLNNVAITTADNDASQVVMMAPPGNGPMPDGSLGPLSTGPGFPGFWWIGLSTYKGIADWNGQICYHYSLVPPPPPASTPLQSRTMTRKVIGGKTFVDEVESSPTRTKSWEAQAWINVQTKLPAGLLTDGTLYTYTFLSPPTNPLDLPAPMKSAWERQRARAERLRQLEQQNR